MKKKLAAILCCTLLCQTSCGFIVFHDPNAETTETAVPVTEETTVEVTQPITTAVDDVTAAETRLSLLPDKNMNSSNIIIATTNADMVSPTEAGDHYTSAKIAAVGLVSEKYNTRILPYAADWDRLFDEAVKAEASGMYFADLLAIPQNKVGALWAKGILANMNGLPYTDYTADYYNETLNRSAVIGSMQTAVYGDATLDPRTLPCIYYNRRLAAEVLKEDIEAIVDSGKWTWDKMNELASAVCQADSTGNVIGYGISDINKTIQPEINEDGKPIGVARQVISDELIDSAVLSMGLTYVENRFAETPVTVYMYDDEYVAKANNVVDILYNFIYKNEARIKDSDTVAKDLFSEGNLLFCIDTLASVPDFANLPDSWGILPLPKYDESQSDYITPVPSNQIVYCSLAGNPDYETGGLILEAMNAASHQLVLDAYYNEMLQYYLRNEASFYAIENIVNNVNTDFALLFGSGFTNLSNATNTAVYTAVTTTSKLKTCYDRYKNVLNREFAAVRTIG